MKSINRPAMAALTVLLLFPSACTWVSGPREPETNEMHRRFSRTVDIQTGVVLGDLSRVQTGATRLATYEETGPLPSGSASFPEEIRGYASLIAQASDLDSVAENLGQIAATCGSCHTATGGGPRFVVGSGPPTGKSQGDTMIRHLWAADRMWEGLVGPSEEAWNAGSQALDRDWAGGRALVQAAADSEATIGYIGRIRALGHQALDTRTPKARAAVYAELLRTCNGCHTSMGIMAER